MKKLLFITAALALVLALAATAYAASPARVRGGCDTADCPRSAHCQFADADGDGICDNCPKTADDSICPRNSQCPMNTGNARRTMACQEEGGCPGHGTWGRKGQGRGFCRGCK